MFLDTVRSLPGVIATAGTPRPPISPSAGALPDQCASWTIRHSTARLCSPGPAILRTSFNRLHKGLQDQSSSCSCPTPAPPQPDSSQFSVAPSSKTIPSQNHGGTGYNKSLKNRNLQLIAVDDSERQSGRRSSGSRSSGSPPSRPSWRSSSPPLFPGFTQARSPTEMRSAPELITSSETADSSPGIPNRLHPLHPHRRRGLHLRWHADGGSLRPYASSIIQAAVLNPALFWINAGPSITGRAFKIIMNLTGISIVIAPAPPDLPGRAMDHCSLSPS